MGGAEEFDGPVDRGCEDGPSGFKIEATTRAILCTSASERPEVLGVAAGNEAVGANGEAAGTVLSPNSAGGVAIATRYGNNDWLKATDLDDSRAS